MACGSPPANTCENASTLRVYNAAGTCSLGACSYGYGFVSCPTGCSSGSCNPSGWVQMTSNTNVNLETVWGTSANAVWAGGSQGTALFYNGSQWQVRPVPQQAVGNYISAFHGTAANNVYALAYTSLIHFDGNAWSFVADFSLACTRTTGLYATGNATNDVYVSCWVGGSVNAQDLYLVDGTGKITSVGGFSDGSCFNDSHGIWGFSPTNIYMAGCKTHQWDGTKMNLLTGGVFSTELWAANPMALFTVDYENDQSSSAVQLWNGMTWTPLNTGFNGTLTGLWGTASNRLFVSAYDSSYKGAILYYDGVGFTRQTLPSGLGSLQAVWAAPSGEVFAVGAGGLIVKGP
jgi:hypothetical protein